MAMARTSREEAIVGGEDDGGLPGRQRRYILECLVRGRECDHSAHHHHASVSTQGTRAIGACGRPYLLRVMEGLTSARQALKMASLGPGHTTIWPGA
jgi:hypothetical protein